MRISIKSALNKYIALPNKRIMTNYKKYLQKYAYYVDNRHIFDYTDSKLSIEVLIMPNTSMNIRMDSEVKRQAQELFAQFGLDMTTAVNMFLRQSIIQQGIPFSLQLNPSNNIKSELEFAKMQRESGIVGRSAYEVISDMHQIVAEAEKSYE